MMSWRTSLGGIIAAIGITLQDIGGPVWLKAIALVFAALGMLLMGVTARDSQVTSEAAGAKPTIRTWNPGARPLPIPEEHIAVVQPTLPAHGAAPPERLAQLAEPLIVAVAPTPPVSQ